MSTESLLAALREIGGTPGEQVPNCRGGCHRWSTDCDDILVHPEHNHAHGPFRCPGAIARAAIAAEEKSKPKEAAPAEGSKPANKGTGRSAREVAHEVRVRLDPGALPCCGDDHRVSCEQMTAAIERDRSTRGTGGSTGQEPR